MRFAIQISLELFFSPQQLLVLFRAISFYLGNFQSSGSMCDSTFLVINGSGDPSNEKMSSRVVRIKTWAPVLRRKSGLPEFYDSLGPFPGFFS